MSETGTLTSRVAAALRRRETLRIAAPAGVAVVVVGVLLGVFLTGGDEQGTSGQSVDIADRAVEQAEPSTADAGALKPSEEEAPDTADAGAPEPAETKPEQTAEAPPVPADVPGGDIGAGVEDEETAEPRRLRPRSRRG